MQSKIGSGASTDIAPGPVRTVSHTMDATLAEELRNLAFEFRLSESAILEYAFATLLESANPTQIVTRMRALGYGLRRKT